MIRKVSHIGIAVKSLEESIPLYEKAYGIACSSREEVASQKVKVAFFQVGDTRIELLEPMNPESPIAKFIETKGEGIHHIAFETDDIAAQLQQAKNCNVRLINETPVPGAHGMQVAFLHPKSTFGVLTEFCADPHHH
jgi:methylmalonyl-CoA/ethylmalonyl-CoA epimerase